MKKLLFCLMIMLLPIMAVADFLGIKKADEYVTFQVFALDSAGAEILPDSVHVFTMLDQNGLALAFNTRSTTYPFAIGIDTSKIYGDTTYWFNDQIQDIDGTPSPSSQYSLAIDIVMWGDEEPTHNRAIVQVIADSLQNYLDSTALATAAAGADATWDELVSGHAVALSFGDSLIQAISGQGVIVTTNNDKTGYTLTTANINTVAGESADSVWEELIASHVTVLTFGDSLPKMLEVIRDTSNAAVDTLQRFTERQTDSLQAILDSIQNIATLTDMADSVFGRWAVTRGIVSGTPNVAGFASVALTQVDDYWIDQWVFFLDGALAKQAFRVNDFTAATDSITLLPVAPEVMAVGDSFYVLGMFSESPAAGSVTDANIDAIVDTIFARDSSDINSGAATSFGTLMAKEAYVSGTGGVSAADIVAIADTIFGRDSADVNAGTATSYGTLMMKPTYVQGAASGLTAAEVADSVWEELLADHSTVLTFGDSLPKMLQAILDSLQSQDDWVAQNAYFDTLIYVGPRGLGIYLDSTAANTNTVLGTDGTAKNPVSTFVAARTLADALGTRRYYLTNRSTFLGATVDPAVAHLSWEFIGIGHQNKMAFGTQQYTGSYFENLDVEGALHASGGHIMFQRCVFGFVSSNFAGHVYESIFTDTIVMKVGRDLYFVDCASSVAGNMTPTIDLVGASSIVQLRNYSGGIRIMNGSSNDTLSVETDGQVIISANNTSTVITVRGMASITDSGTTTDLTQDAVWNRGSVDTVFIPAMVDSNWDELVAGHTTALSYGDTLPKMIEAIKDSLESQDDWVAQNAYFDTLIYDGPNGLGIYLDSAAANTNTTFGTDGTAKNPVSTLVAARTLADALGHKRYYIINRSTFNAAANDLAAAHQDWEFIGLGYFPGIAFGGQLVDGSMFRNLTVSGALAAGGTSVQYDYCVLGYITANFNGHADNCWLTDTIVVKSNPSIAFTDCESAVPGNNAPTLDMSAGATSVSIRSYSGGLRIMNGTSTDTISLETDGQVIISANNTSLNITLRGMMTVTDSGTTSAITEDAVWNRGSVDTVFIPATVDSTFSEILNSYTTMETFGAAMLGLVPKQDSVKDSTANTVSAFKTTLNLVGQIEGSEITFIANGETRTITSYSQIPGWITIYPPLNAEPASNAIFVLHGARTAKIDRTPEVFVNIDSASGTFDSSQFDINWLYNFWAYNDSTAPDLENELTKWMVNNLAGGAASISAADMASIIDTLQNRDSTDFNSGGATSFGVLMMDPTYVQGSSSLTAGEIGDTMRAALGDSIRTVSGGFVRGFFVIDTSGADDSLPAIAITLQDVNSANRYNIITNSAGFQTINLPGSTWTAKAVSPGYAFVDTTFSATADDTLSIKGYNITVSSPGGGNEVKIFGYSYDILDTADAMADVWVFMEPTAQANNTCDSTLTPRFMKRKLTDATGYFEFIVVRSSCLSDTEYRIWLKWEGGQTDKHEFVAPDAATFRILW